MRISETMLPSSVLNTYALRFQQVYRNSHNTLPDRLAQAHNKKTKTQILSGRWKFT